MAQCSMDADELAGVSGARVVEQLPGDLRELLPCRGSSMWAGTSNNFLLCIAYGFLPYDPLILPASVASASDPVDRARSVALAARCS